MINRLAVTVLVLVFSHSLHAQHDVEFEGKPLFEPVSSAHSGVTFSNDLELDLKSKVNFDYVYAGGGVAVGDINNDGLVDIYFVGNSVSDQLYLNKGGFVFENVTEKALPQISGGWNTGVNMTDVNADGYLDIVVSRLNVEIIGKSNLVFINNKDLTFTESSNQLGFVDTSVTFQTMFFDFDRDGDLDCYVLNSVRHAFFDDYGVEKSPMSDIIYRNENGIYIDASREVGVENYSFGLGVLGSDFNNDGAMDVYVSNDFEGRDYLFLNEQGKLQDRIREQTKHISFYGMGVDAADINNDELIDVMVVDMGYSDHVKSKQNMPSMSTKDFWRNVIDGNHYSYMQNTLQINNGNGSFSEVAQLAGVAKTDWSWGILFEDFDNDGLKDIVITNGIKRELMHQDYYQDRGSGYQSSDTTIFKSIPESKSRNKLYKNNGDLTFSDVSLQWGFENEFNSSGVAYADFDNDGDMDLVINNLDTICSIYENQLNEDGKYLNVQLIGSAKNHFAIGAKVTIYTSTGVQTKELSPVRGFLSSVDYRLHFGLGNDETVEKIKIRWPDNKVTFIKNVKANQFLKVSYAKSVFSSDDANEVDDRVYFTNSTDEISVDYEHNENKYNDFDRELLLPHMYSRLGPTISTGDINNDGLDDFFVGSPNGQTSNIFVQTKGGKFESLRQKDLSEDSLYEDVGSAFFDVDNDNDLDLYVASGGNDFEKDTPNFQDRLYLNDGKGHFKRSMDALPSILSSTKVVTPLDFDGDGDMDLFVGGRVSPGRFPTPPRSYLLQNNKGKFSDVTDQVAKGLSHIGMVTEAKYVDVNGDKAKDLVLIGEWMPLIIFLNEGGVFVRKDPDVATEGLWYSMEVVDVDMDGDMDVVAGNLGKNSKYKASVDYPFNVYGNDFDNNGTFDIVLSKYQDTIHYPVRGRECSSQQMPFITSKFPTYKAFSIANMDEIYGEELNEGVHHSARTLYSSIFLNDGKGNFEMKKLPNEAQFSPIQSIISTDLNQDGNIDFVMAGNMYETEVETVRYDAGRGVCLLGDGKGGFNALSIQESGFFAWDNLKTMNQMTIKGEKHLVLGINNRALKFFKYLK